MSQQMSKTETYLLRYFRNEYDCHVFSKYLVFQVKNLVFRLETLDFNRKS